RRLRDSYGKIDLRTLRIKDYLGREGLMTTASFKLMEPSKEDEIMRRFSDAILGFSVSIMTDVGRKSLSVAKNGSVRASEDVPEDIIEAVLGYLPQFHEEVEVETVEI
ncbi:MAG: hypothetical protein L6Q71_11560, partial [Planctomycetes bacterium]|nr:hypothetical protein [Planctomycetota bacterium]